MDTMSVQESYGHDQEKSSGQGLLMLWQQFTNKVIKVINFGHKIK